jgi:hypothetical protein
MDRFHATTLQQHSGSCESQRSPDVVVGKGVVKLNIPIVSVRHARIQISIRCQYSRGVRTTGVARLPQALVRPARGLADDRRVPVQLVCRARRRIRGDGGACASKHA